MCNDVASHAPISYARTNWQAENYKDVHKVCLLNNEVLYLLYSYRAHIFSCKPLAHIEELTMAMKGNLEILSLLVLCYMYLVLCLQ